jgi:hypothetical protein
MTRGIKAMKWDQIESKWALMTRRIRADFGDARIAVSDVSGRSLDRRDRLAPAIADSQAFAVKQSEFKTSAK